MATYKGIGYDTANGKTRTGTSSDDISFDAQITATDAISVTSGGINVVGGTSSDTLSTTGDASIGGDLTVTGDIISRGEVNLVVEDPFIDLGVGNSTTAAEASGFTFSLNRNSGFTAETITAATAGDSGAPSAPTLTSSTNPSQFAAGDLLVLSGSDNNNGIFVVASVSGATITLKGTGGSAISGSVPFAQNQVETETGQTATAYKVDIKVLAVADGSNFADSNGTQYTKGTLIEIYVANANESDFTSNGDYSEVGATSSSLQLAYDGGATITTASSADIAFTLASGNFTVQNGSIDFGSSTALSTFNLDTSGAITLDSSGGAISLDGAGASNFTTSSGALTLDGAGGVSIAGNTAEIDVTTTGLVDVNSAAFDLDASGNITIDTTSNDASALTLTTNGGTDEKIQITNTQGTATDAITIDASAGGFAISASASSVVGTDSAQLQLLTLNSGEIDITSAGDVDINASGTFDVLATGAFSIDGTGASNVTATSGNLTLSTATSGTLIASSAGDVDIDGASITVDATAGISLDSATSSNFTMTANNASTQTLTIEASNSNVGADGNILINSDGTQFQIGGVQKVDISSGVTQISNVLECDTTNGLRFGGAGANVVDRILDEDDMASDDVNALATQQSIKAYVDSFGQPNYLSLLELTADATGVAARDVIAIDSSGNATKADANDSAKVQIVGFALNTASSGQTVKVAQVGVLGGLSGLSAGSRYYVSTTAGGITATPPSASGDVIFQVGYAVSATEIAISLDFVMELG